MGYRKIADIGDVKPEELKRITTDGGVLVLANVDGAYYALDNRCPHMGGSLADGELGGATITCPRHGAKFDVRTGKNVGSAKLAFIGVKVGDAKSIPVKAEGGDILADLD